MDEQMRRERARREKRRRKKRLRKHILQIEVCGLVLIFAVLFIVAVKEWNNNKAKQEEQQRTETPQNESANEQAQQDESHNALKIEKKEETVNEAQTDTHKATEAEAEQSESENEGDKIKIEDDETGEIVLTFGGDVCFHDEYSNMYSYVQKGSDISKCISTELLSEMRGADVFMINNEFPYTTRGEPIEDKAFTLCSNPQNVSILSDMGVDIVSLANNHVYDYGEISLLDTLDTLENAGVPYVGAGRNIEEASKTVIFEKNGIKVAYLSATQIEKLNNPDTKGATAEKAGTFRCWGSELTNLTEAIGEAEKENDFVVVYIHWGTENTDELDWAQLEQAKAIADAGADLIIGDHPHCLQQFADVNGVPVIYSLGNFWFNSKTVDTGLVKVTLNHDGIKSYQFLPAIQQNCVTSMADGAEKERILEYMRQISTGVTIDGDGFVSF